MSDLSQRTAAGRREVRTFGFELRRAGDGRTLEGLAAPFNSPTEIRDAYGTFTEVILPGSFTRTIAERGQKIPLMANHDRSTFPLGKIDQLWEAADGLHLRSRIADTSAGNDALTLVREDIVTGLSIGFQPVQQSWNAGATERTISEAKLFEVSLVTEPAYAEAGVTAVRSVGLSVADALAALNPSSVDLPAGRSVALASMALALLEKSSYV
jgi:HK97 family phage prohead protease